MKGYELIGVDTEKLAAFVRESNAIEGIFGDPTKVEVDVHRWLLERETLRIEDVERLVTAVTQERGTPEHVGRLRRLPGMDVRVGGFIPPEGGNRVVDLLGSLLSLISMGNIEPWTAHVRYEVLHPFTDGNGRSGRAIWAWHTRQLGKDPFTRPFLQTAYYEALKQAGEEGRWP